METACPHCGKKYKVPDSAVGKQARCGNPQCKQTFVVSAPQGAQPSAAPKAAAGAAKPQQPAAPKAAKPQQPAAKPSGAAAAPRPAGAAPAAPTPAGPPPLAAAAPPPVPATDPLLGATPAAGAGPSPLDALLSADLGAPAAAPTGPLAPAGPLAPLAPAVRRRKRNYKPLVFGLAGGAAVIAVILGVYFLIAGLGGGGGGGGGPRSTIPAWAGSFVPPDAQGVLYFNLDKLRRSELYATVQRLIPSAAPMGPGPTFTQVASFLENFSEVFVVLAAKGKPVFVLRSREDLPLEKLVSMARDLQPKTPFGTSGPAAPNPELKTLGAVQYTLNPAGGAFAKTGSSTFCGTQSEEDLKALLGRLERNEATPLGQEVQRALQEARGDHFIAVTGLGEMASQSPLPGGMRIPGMNLRPQWAGIGFSADTQLRVDGAVGFGSDREAQDLKKKWDDIVKEAERDLRNVSPQDRDLPNKVMGLMTAVRLSASGSALRISGSWRVKDIEDTVTQTMSMVKERGFGGAGLPRPGSPPVVPPIGGPGSRKGLPRGGPR
jgi:hypothetical protein